MKIIKKIISLGSIFGFGKKKLKSTSKKKSQNFKSGNPLRKDAKAGALKKNLGKKSTSEFNQSGKSRDSKARKNSRLNPKFEVKYQNKSVLQIENLETLKEDVALFANLGLSDKILAAIRDLSYQEPTDIQLKAIPIALSGKDIVGTAQTGTGKTAAFALPLLDKLEASKTPTALILSPTRELACQICDAVLSFCKYTPIKATLIQGGVSAERQIASIKNGTDILVATPGRLLDLVEQGILNLSNIKYLILDEVDRMFDMGFIDDVSRIIRMCAKERQTLFFSATMPDAVMKLSKWALKDPERIEIGIIHAPADTIEHFVYPVDSIQKYDMILAILNDIKSESTIVFTRTRMDADRVSQWLEAHDYKVATLHSDRTQREREKALNDFKEGRSNVLVATDIASRGLDISNVACVINYNVPEHSEDYVHRIGRTGRAHKEGKAITLFASEELPFLQRIERFIGRNIERRKLENFEYRFEPDLGSQVKQKRRRNR